MDDKVLLSELKFKAVRSSGSGGQNVNKVATKIELSFNLENSLAFSDDEKSRLQKRLSTRLTNDNNIVLQCDESRSQFKNKEIVIARFSILLKTG